ncbi:MAG: ANTAR domain-containing protein [Actinomycetota bacterium]|nr:ANTAR domain-containing protein [Actinomycetota bacterium]
MRLRGRILGALNLFRYEPGALGPADVTAGQALADVATIALLQSRAIREAHVIADQLQQALQSRVAIEQAKGMLAEQAGVDMSEAFERLRGHARDRQRRLGEVAEDVVRGHLTAAQMAPREAAPSQMRQ